MAEYIALSRQVERERETEQWLRSKDWSEIVKRIHELEDQIQDLEVALEAAEERYRYIT